MSYTIGQYLVLFSGGGITAYAGRSREYVGQLAIQLNSSRSIAGPVQEQWIMDSLKSSQDRGTVWRMILNQVIFGS